MKLASDARYDSPGRSARYTVLDSVSIDSGEIWLYTSCSVKPRKIALKYHKYHASCNVLL